MKRIAIAALTLTFAAASHASSGKTADGCSYKVINGQYLTSCEPKSRAAGQVVTVAAAPVTSYGSVPVRSNPEAPIPSVQTAPQTMTMSLTTPVQSSLVREEKEEIRDNSDLVDRAYAGAQLGSTSIKEAGSGLSLGVVLGTSIDDYFAVELGYTYANQGMNLGLDTRGTELGSTYPARDDVSLKSHLITTELQGYATDVSRRLRPYLGLGLGLKASSLTEKNLGYYGENAGGTLSQTTFGGIGSAGAKLRVAKGFHLGLAFRYFFPLARQNSKLEGNPGKGYDLAYTPTRLTQADDALTGASQYQLQGGLEYTF